MPLIAILISLWANRYPQWVDGWRRPESWYGYADWLRLRVLGLPRWQGLPGLLAFLLPPLLLVALLQWWLRDLPLGLLELLLAVPALLFAHGPARVDHELREFVAAWEQEDMARVHLATQALTGDNETPAQVDRLPEQALAGLFWQGYQRLLGPIFWFVLLGPFGAVLFRLVYIAKGYADSRDESSQGFGRAVCGLLYGLDWVPVRLAAIAFGLAGSFVHAMQGWKAASVDAFAGNRGLLVRSGVGALNMPLTDVAPQTVKTTARQARSLVTRSVLCWLAVIALATIIGWLG